MASQQTKNHYFLYLFIFCILLIQQYYRPLIIRHPGGISFVVNLRSRSLTVSVIPPRLLLHITRAMHDCEVQETKSQPRLCTNVKQEIERADN